LSDINPSVKIRLMDDYGLDINEVTKVID